LPIYFGQTVPVTRTVETMAAISWVEDRYFSIAST